MKKFLFFPSSLIVLIFLHLSFNSFAQNVSSLTPLEAYLKNEGVKTMAQLAHAFNTFSSGYYSVGSDNIISLEVTYTNGNSETIVFQYNEKDDYFDNVRAISGPEYGYSFLAAQTLINILLPTNREKSCLENFFHTSLNNMSGEQLAAAIITNGWWAWKGKPCK